MSKKIMTRSQRLLKLTLMSMTKSDSQMKEPIDSTLEKDEYVSSSSPEESILTVNQFGEMGAEKEDAVTNKDDTLDAQTEQANGINIEPIVDVPLLHEPSLKSQRQSDGADKIIPADNILQSADTVVFQEVESSQVRGADRPARPCLFCGKFKNDPTFRRRTEDSIIAWTWRSFLDSPEPSDPTVIERMPMTKAAKRGLDTITAYSKIRVPEADIQKFAVTGASKRGWTVWSLAAVDQRVVAMVPMVFSMINIDGGTFLQHNQNMDGGWSFVFDPYWRENLTQEYYNPKMTRVWDVEDVYRYKERLTLPILEMVSSGDEFFLLDDNHNWWNDIPEPKWLMMLPNAEHTMAPHYLQIYETLVSFILCIVQEVEIPSVSWTLGNTDTGAFVRYAANPPPSIVTAYWAETLSNDTRRDFRLFSLEAGNEDPTFHPVGWRHNITVEDMGNGEYYVEKELVDGEWIGLFVEGEWEGPSGLRMVFTSQVNIAPNTFPRPVCTDADSCWGYLV